MIDVLAGVQRHIDNDRSPIPIPFRTKRPVIKKWQKLRITAKTAPKYFNGAPSNVGALTGAPSGDQVATDVDCPEGLSLAPLLLPATTFTDGRDDIPPSHYWYTATGAALKTHRFDDPLRAKNQEPNARIVELLADGAQAIVWPSIHPDGARYRPLPDGKPPTVAYDELLASVRRLAATVLAARYWPHEASHIRHNTALALSGYLLNGGVSESVVAAVVKAAVTVAGDDDPGDRVRAVADTAHKIANGEPVQGGPTLVRLMPPVIVEQIGEWLGRKKGRADGSASADWGADWGAGGDDGSDDQSRTDEAPQRFRPNDVGNAERLIARHGHILRYVPAWGWMAHDGRRWVRDEDDVHVTRLAVETVRAIYEEAAAEEDSDRRAALAKHAAASERGARISAMVSLARVHRAVEAAPDLFDADPYLLTCLSGTLDLRTGELRAHRREDFITKLAPVNYDPEAAAPTWGAFLARIFDGNAALIAYVQRAAGYSATGDTSERAVFIAHGSGANGKTTLLETLRAALGDYALRTPAETLLAKREGGVPSDVARLRGARLVTASETEDGRRLAEAFIKDLSGGDTLSTRFLYGNWFDFRPVCKVWLATNHKPVIRGTDNAIWDRLRLIPFAISIPKEERDRQLAAKLRAELPGVLAWIVRGALAWRRGGLQEPEAVKDATGAYRSEQDVLGAFLAERCVFSPRAAAPAAQLYKAYTDWCEEGGERPHPQRTFGMRLAERGFERQKRHGTFWWTGVGLLTTDDPPPGRAPGGDDGDEGGPAGGKVPPKESSAGFAETSSPSSPPSPDSAKPSEEAARCGKCGEPLGNIIVESDGRLYCDRHDLWDLEDPPPEAEAAPPPDVNIPTACTSCSGFLNDARACPVCRLRWCWRCGQPAGWERGECDECGKAKRKRGRT